MNKKYIKYAAIAGGVLLVLYILKRNKDKSNSSGGNNNSGGGGVKDQDLPYTSMADEIFEAMNGYGTNEAKINAVLERLQKKSHWDSLVSAYGIRKLSSGRGNVFVSDFTGNLPNSLINELDSSELKTVNNILSKIGVSI